jgi:amidohydrolase
LSAEELKGRVRKAIRRRAKEIVKIGDQIFKRPELGFKEFETAKLVQQTFKKLGLPYESEVAITGVIANLEGNSRGPKISVMGELDSVLCYSHPYADKVTGAVHACGHNAQIAAMLGVAMGFVDARIMGELPGAISFMAVPAEEYVEIEYRLRLRDEGKIKFLGGKQEFIRLGKMNSVDMTVKHHTRSGKLERKAWIGATNNGFVGKAIRYRGREAHAGGAPEKGINALNAAMLGIMGIHTLRETFRDGDHIRVHPIITRGGDLVNIIPADVRIETYVRGKTTDAILEASRKVNRALKGGAMTVGAKVEIEEIPGYLPLKNDPEMSKIFGENARQILGKAAVKQDEHRTGSTDTGDISAIMPAIEPSITGATGTGHGSDYKIADKEMCYIIPAELMAMTVIDLLYDDAAKARRVVKAFKPEIKRQEYVRYWERLLQ